MSAMRDAIVSRIRETLPNLRLVAPHGGDFTPQELDRYMTNAPAVFVVNRGAVGVVDYAGEQLVRDRWAACVVARDLPANTESDRVPKADLARRIARTVAKLVAVERWGGTGATGATGITITNLYSASGDAKGAAFWVVSWEQPEDDTSAGAAQLDDLLRIHTDYDLAPPDAHIDASDVTTFPEGD